MREMNIFGNYLRGSFFVPALCILFAAAMSPPAHAQLTIDVTTSAGRQVPVAIIAFANEANAPQNITPVIADNLKNTGLFRLVNTGGISQLPTEPSEINF